MTEYKKEAPRFNENKTETIEDQLADAISYIADASVHLLNVQTRSKDKLHNAIDAIRRAWDLVPEPQSVMDHSESLSRKDAFHA